MTFSSLCASHETLLELDSFFTMFYTSSYGTIYLVACHNTNYWNESFCLYSCYLQLDSLFFPANMPEGGFLLLCECCLLKFIRLAALTVDILLNNKVCIKSYSENIPKLLFVL